MPRQPRDNPRRRPCRILAICEGVIPTVHLVADMPLRWLARRGLCEYRFLTLGQVRPADLHHADVLLCIRGASVRSLAVCREARRLGLYVIAYWDDNPFLIPSYSLSSEHFRQPQIVRAMRRIIDLADLLTVSTDRLGRELPGDKPFHRLAVPAVDVIRRLPRPASNGRATLGFAGSLDHRMMLEQLVLPALETLAAGGAAFRLQLVGPSVRLPARLTERVEHLPFFDSYDDWIRFRNSARWDVSLAPLQYSPFTACKYPNKFVESASAGLPCVFSDVPPFSDIVRHGRTGLLVPNEPAAWAEAIGELLANPQRRRDIAENAWRYVKEHNGRAGVEQSYCRVLKEALAHRANPMMARMGGAGRAISHVRISGGRVLAYGPLAGVRRSAQLVGRPWLDSYIAGRDLPRVDPVPAWQGIARAEVVIGTHGRMVRGTITAELLTTGDQVIASARGDLRQIPDNSSFTFAFDPPVPPRRYRRLRLRLRTDAADPVAAYVHLPGLANRALRKGLKATGLIPRGRIGRLKVALR